MRWWWILLGAFLAESVTVVLIMLLRLAYGQAAFVSSAQLPAFGRYAFLAGVFGSLLFFAFWVARKAITRPIVHGLLVGVAAVLIYELLTFGLPIPTTWYYFFVHGLKLLGGAAGGYLGARRSRRLFAV
jgi:hypothetical protein